MGGCATKPLVLKEETEALKPAEDVVEPAKAEEAGSGEEQKEAAKSEEAEGQKSLCNLFQAKEAEEAAGAAAGEEKQQEENVKASTEEAESKPEVSEFNAEDAPAEEKQQ